MTYCVFSDGNNDTFYRPDKSPTADKEQIAYSWRIGIITGLFDRKSE